jgi:hypothetical protein
MAGFLKANQAGALGLSPGDKDLVTIQTPDGAKFRVARKVAPQFNAFLTDLHGTGYKLNPKVSGGYNYRTIAGTPKLSQHAYGNAIDLNWDKNPYGSKRSDLPANVGEIAAKHGIAWGGTWRNPDPMHFEVSTLSPGAPAANYVAANAANEVANNGAPKEMASPIGGAPVAGGPVPLDLVPPSQRQSKLAEALLQKGLTAKPQGWGDVLNSLSATFAGQYLGDKADKQQQEYQGKLVQRLREAAQGGDTNNLASTLIGSGNPELVQQGVALKVAQAKPQTQVGRFRPSKQGVIDTVTGQVVPGTEGNTAEAAEYGTSPQYFVDKDGNLKVGQLSKAGGMKPVELPEGAKAWSPGIDYKDTGTGFVGLNKRTGQVEGSIAKDVAGEASATVAGKAQGQANVDLPSVESATNVLLGRIDDVANDPYLTRMTGPIDARLPNVSGDSVRIQSKIDQLQGDAFLQAFESIKGAGQISEVEGAKAEKAKSRLMALGVNDKDYPAALNDFKNEVVRLRDLVRAKAGKGAAPAPATRLKYNPATGEFE